MKLFGVIVEVKYRMVGFFILYLFIILFIYYFVFIG